MSLLSGKLLCRRSFKWGEKKNADGSLRAAGSMSSFTVYEEGPSLESSSVLEVVIPEELTKEANKHFADFVPLSLVECHVQHQGKGRAQLLGF